MGRSFLLIGYLMGEITKYNGVRTASPEYRTWQMMKNRCLNPFAEDYSYYGARGVTLDPHWRVFKIFLIDMGRRPTPLHTLERIDNNLGYSKSNCEWATRETQARNRPTYNKLDKATADLIRKAYVRGVTRQVDIANQFGVSQVLVSQVIRNLIWR